ncbi:PucR family transcriptional regulator ligand-binding domain-containing protein [Streptomyces sp. NPDC007206]|uniref:PucR family transcriptional regulator ligand-binding domain-containing protein n=1 Tax=Streptomyces sp. NPDC007206 TaxID=3154317 RepID=UPI0033D79AE1
MPETSAPIAPAVPPTPPVPLSALLAREDLALRQIAGPSDPSVVIHWAHTSEMADPYPYLLGGELLLTAGVHIPEAAGSGTYFDDYVSRIVEAGGAALGFGVAPVHDTVPRALVAACERHGLPLLEVPPRTTFSGVARAVWQLMAQARLAELRRVTEAQQSLAAAAARPDPVPSVLRRLARHLSGHAVLYGPDGTPLATAGRTPPEETGRALAALAAVVRPTDGQAAQEQSASGPAAQAGPTSAPGARPRPTSGPTVSARSASDPAATARPTTSSAAVAGPTSGPAASAPPSSSPAAQARPASDPAGTARPTTSSTAVAGPTSGPAAQAHPTSSPAAQARPASDPAATARPTTSSAAVAGPTSGPAVQAPPASGPAPVGDRASGDGTSAGAVRGARPAATGSAGPRPAAARTGATGPAAARTGAGRPSPASATDTLGDTHLSVYALGSGGGFVLGVATARREPGDHTIASVASVLLSLLTGEHHSGAGAARSSALVRLLLGSPPEEVAPLLGAGQWFVVHARPEAQPPDAVAASALGAALGSPLVDVGRDGVRVLVPGGRPPQPQAGWTLGVSAAVEPREWPAADAQAARALARARATRAPLVRHGTRPGLEDLVPQADAQAHARALLAPLAGRPELAETLRNWLALHGSWDRTAVALEVHRNTVRQRIARCAALLDADLDDPDVRMELWFALRHG